MVHRYLTINDVADRLTDALVFVRVDTNTTLMKGEFSSNERIVASGNTIKSLTGKGAKVIVGTHNGRKGNPDYVSVGPLAQIFRNFVIDVKTIGNTYNGEYEGFNDDAIRTIQGLRGGEALLLENLRFMPGESDKLTPTEYAQSSFVRTLIDNCGVQFMVMDGFSVAHRECRSMLGFDEIPIVAGLTMDNELSSLNTAYKFFYGDEPANVYILGGKKIQDYFSLIQNSLKQGVVQKILAGGFLGQLLLYVRGIDVGEPSLKPLKKVSGGKSVMDFANLLATLDEGHKDVFVAPIDVAYNVNGQRKDYLISEIPSDVSGKYPIMDIGFQTAAMYEELIRESKLAYIKGPMGVFEELAFNAGSRAVVHAATSPNVYSVMGGGDTSAMLTHFKIPEGRINHVSLAGGALLNALAGESLPGIEALERSFDRYQQQFRS